MNRKLAIRNVMRLAKDYLVYFLTMTFVTALMFAFNSILFSEDVQKLFDIAGMMAAMVGIATFFIASHCEWQAFYSSASSPPVRDSTSRISFKKSLLVFFPLTSS